MKLPKVECYYPATVEEATLLLVQGGAEAVPVAGGTDILVRLKQRTLLPSMIVKLTRIPTLNFVKFDPDEGLLVGSATRLVEIIRNPLIRSSYPALVEAASLVGAVQHQNMGTLGGNICQNTRCWFFNRSDLWRRSRGDCFKTGGSVCHAAKKRESCSAVYQGDAGAILCALRSRVEVQKGAARRWLPIEELFTGDGKAPHRIEAGELLTAIQVPPPRPGEKSFYKKYRVRHSIDFPLAGVAGKALLDEGRLKECCLFAVGLGSAPIRLPEVEKMVAESGWRWDEKASCWGSLEKAIRTSCAPVDNVRAKPVQRLAMAGLMIKEALLALTQGVNGGKQHSVERGE